MNFLLIITFIVLLLSYYLYYIIKWTKGDKADKQIVVYCNKCGGLTKHVKRGISGFNLRYKCLECNNINWEENNYLKKGEKTT